MIEFSWWQLNNLTRSDLNWLVDFCKKRYNSMVRNGTITDPADKLVAGRLDIYIHMIRKVLNA